MPKKRIFISRCTPFTPQQEAFIEKFKQFLRNRDCEPIIIGDTIEGVRPVVEQAREEMAKCDGTIVVAFKRISIERGTDKPSSNNATSIDGRQLPTVWNHMEAAMAYTHHLPLLVLVEDGLHREGMLSKRIEWDAMGFTIDLALFESSSFINRINDWFRFVESPDSKRSFDPGTLTIRQWIGALTPKQLWGICASVIGLLAAVFVIGLKLSEIF